MSREASRPGAEATVKKDSVTDSDNAQLAAAMSELDETLLLHGSVVSQSAELMSLVGDQLHEREKSLGQLIERAERCAAGIEQSLSPPAWRSVLTGAGWALVGALAAIVGMAGPLLWELAR